MVRCSDRARNRTLAAVALLVFTVLAAGGAHVHTDDGCEIELHCVACKWSYGAVPALALALTVALALLAGGHAPQRQPLAIPWVARRQQRSRGPPLS